MVQDLNFIIKKKGKKKCNLMGSYKIKWVKLII